MSDQPDKQGTPPTQPPEKSGWVSGQPVGGWREPPVDDESSRPVFVGWHTGEASAQEPPPTAEAQPETEEAAPEPAAELPGTAPERAGAWYTPFDAELQALLSGAASTIVEPLLLQPTAETQPLPAPEDTQPQPAADTQELAAAGAAEEMETGPVTPEEIHALSAEESDIEAGSTPVSDVTPVEPMPAEASPGLTPAEAAFLAEQRAAATTTETSPDAGDVLQTAAPQTETPAAAATPAAPVRPSPFEEVERKVSVLRQRYQAGQLTREELQNELRNLMILDDDGRWWMLGLETNRWYYYDGRDWVPADPPGYLDRVQGSAVPTETGLQQVLLDAEGTPETAAQSGGFHIEIDEDGMPLPERVPQEDPGATMVSPSSPFLEPMRPSEAPTHPRLNQVGADSETGGFVSHPVRPGQQDQPGLQLTQPSRPVGTEDQHTVQSEAVREARGIPVPGQTVAGAAVAAGAAGAASEAVSKPRPRIGEFPQPDYSAALGISRNRNTYVKWGIRVGVFGIIGGMALSLIVLLGMVGYYFYKVNQYSDAVAELSERAANFETTVIMDSGGVTLAEFSDLSTGTTGTRKEIPLDQISPWLIHATVATENETFYTEPGFSVFAIVRATYQNVREGDTVSGASTITQQLARALVLETEFASQRTTERKIVEIIVASEIKRKYTKNEILEIYLNEIFYGNFAYGIEAASQTYFGKSASELNPAEAAFLAGLPQSPATYDPVINREAALQRMHTVLRLMSEANDTGCIRIEHGDTTSWAVPSGGALCITAQEHPDGSFSYFYQTPNMAAPEDMVLDIANVEIRHFEPPSFAATHPHFVKDVWQQLEDRYGSQAIYAAGFRVTTTLNETIQDSAEQAVTDNLATLRANGVDAENASVVAMRPSDGAVLAMVGSADYNNEEIDGQVNIAFTAQQPGSSIKPILYLAALTPDAEGNYWTPATVIWDVPTNFGGYIPLNYDRQYHGPQTLRASLANSLNVPAVKALNDIGLLRFTEVATNMGLQFPLGNPVERSAGLPTALGAVEVRLFDMVRAYATFANRGVEVTPYSIVRIEDSKGNLVFESKPNEEAQQIAPPEYAYLITSILSDNEARAPEFGRGWPLELQNGRIAAVKTGTTDDSRDIWTIGYTPQLAVGVWVGNSDNRPMYGISGYGGAAPIWNEVMESAHAGLAVQQFEQPPNLVQVEVCNDSGTQPSQFCAGRTHWDIFAASAPPPSPDQDIFRKLQVDGYTNRLVNDSCRDDVEERTFLAIDDPTAYDWINNTGEGNAWAANRGIDVPVMPPPTESCDPNQPRPTVVISFPPDNMTGVEGTLPIRGQISMPDFNRYEVRYGVSHDPQAFSQPLAVETVQQPNADSPLAQIDTRQFENGPYTIRLTAIDNFGRSVTRDVRITVNNPAPTAQPTSMPTPTLAPSPTPGAAGATPQPGNIVPQPTLAPTLTPTWTLTPTPQ